MFVSNGTLWYVLAIIVVRMVGLVVVVGYRISRVVGWYTMYLVSSISTMNLKDE